MEKLYRKVQKGKRTVYEPVAYCPNSEITDGVWLVQTQPSSKSITSLFWKVGDIKRPVDVTTHVALQSFERELTNYLMKLCDGNSEEYKEAEKIMGGFLKGPVSYHNISATDLCTLFLRKIAIELEQNETINLKNIMLEFREKTKLYQKEFFDSNVKVLYEFLDYVEKHYKVQLKKIKL
jgi:hypothetical protein